MFALEFPPINAILRWKDFFPTFNKVALIAVVAAAHRLPHLLPRRQQGRHQGAQGRCATSPR